MAAVREVIALRGVVQGVGLRPWAARCAREQRLAGAVRNTGEGVEVELEGERGAVARWLEALRRDPPPGAVIESLQRVRALPLGRRGFRIEPSRACGSGEPTRIPPDAPLCSACLHELFDPVDRRYRYPFTHCSSCGPRASVILSLPYDRQRTTLAPFAPCAACRSEYEDPADRRHHAQSLACPDCGPRLCALAAVAGDGAGDPLEAAVAILAAGGVVALKGYGGFHLLADATCEDAVARLRARKGRPAKPLALLVPDLASARRLARLSTDDERLLAGTARAVVVAPRRADGCAQLGLARGVAPSASDLGLVLPCAPPHWLLLHAPGTRPAAGAPRFCALVFTSANRSGEPTLHRDDDARAALAGIADLVVGHDREVARPSDDPVFRNSSRGPIPVRLSRSTAPLALRLPDVLRGAPPLLALGGDLKCAPALLRGDEILLAEHVGDLGSAAAADALAQRAPALCRLTGASPRAVAHDAHPDSVSAALARALGLPRVAVQHHHAHAAACLVDDGHAGPALALVLDGAGFAEEGSVWGGELLHVSDALARARRVAHLEAVPLPGGDRAAREPWRMAAVWLARAFPQGAPALDWHARRDSRALRAVLGVAARGLASPPTSSCGRLFDAVASLLGLADTVSYEGEAAMALESLATEHPRAAPAGRVRADGPGAAPASAGSIPVADLVRTVALARARGEDAAAIARGFHEELAGRLAGAAARAAREVGCVQVALSGGCFQNRLLLDLVCGELEAAGLEPLRQRRVPPNDGGLAVGQAAVAAARLRASGGELRRAG
jgi:hydrogenase maturation protein HypF